MDTEEDEEEDRRCEDRRCEEVVDKTCMDIGRQQEDLVEEGANELEIKEELEDIVAFKEQRDAEPLMKLQSSHNTQQVWTEI